VRRPVADKAIRPADRKAVPEAPRCWRCGRLLAWEVGQPWRIQCQRCRAENASEPA
jgi:hypothetical protein